MQNVNAGNNIDNVSHLAIDRQCQIGSLSQSLDRLVYLLPRPGAILYHILSVPYSQALAFREPPTFIPRSRGSGGTEFECPVDRRAGWGHL